MKVVKELSITFSCLVNSFQISSIKRSIDDGAPSHFICEHGNSRKSLTKLSGEVLNIPICMNPHRSKPSIFWFTLLPFSHHEL